MGLGFAVTVLPDTGVFSGWHNRFSLALFASFVARPSVIGTVSSDLSDVVFYGVEQRVEQVRVLFVQADFSG